MTALIQVENLRKSFRIGFWMRKIHAVKDVSFEVQSGEIYGIIGPNGAGKTTTIKILTGLVKADCGTVRVAGSSLADVTARRKLGYLPENPYFYEHLKVDELLQFYGRLHGIEQKVLHERIPRLIERVGLSHATERRLSKFSKGMRQRAGIAQALINDPELVILDEPQTGLDPFGRKDVRDLILDLKREGKTVIFSSHILPDVEAVCDRVAILHEGRTVATGTLGELTTQGASAFEVIAQDVDPLPPNANILSTQGGVHTLDFDTEQALQVALKHLLEHGAKVIAVTPRREALEDVFIRDTRDAE